MLENSWMSHTTSAVDGEFRYDFREPPMAGNCAGSERALLAELVQSPAFVRLNDIRFLGSLDYALVDRPNGARGQSRFTRAQHSLGVATLASQYADLVGLPEGKRNLAVAAALLHDIGHAPFSHTLEPLFAERFGVDHHSASEDIILGKADIGREIPRILLGHGIEPDAVIDTLRGDGPSFGGFFSGPINFDTIEGILRSAQYLKMQELGLSPDRVVTAATLRATEAHRHTIDAFWGCKDEIYNVVIRSAAGVLCDLIFLQIARSAGDALSPSDFFSTERRLFEKIPRLRAVLQRGCPESLLRAYLPAEVSFEERRFIIDQSVDFFSRDDKKRYHQSKRKRLLTL